MNSHLRRFFLGDPDGTSSRRPHVMRVFSLFLILLLLAGLFFGLRLYKKHQADKAREERNQILLQQDMQFQRKEGQKRSLPQPAAPSNPQLPSGSLPKQKAPAVQPNTPATGAMPAPKVQAVPPPMIQPARPR